MPRLTTALLGLLLIARLRLDDFVGSRLRRDERGSVTIENVLWAVAVIAIVAIVVAAIRSFVTSESGKIR
ncbi:hypothetical protein ACFVJS_05540 [Nocardioides sp. NPDC057772]|uniref:hypothetical protein n=1 Tax=unclassified Nocardioides TaxID=2615069 RepID=UPI0002028B52|nr:hypothetical protein [Nocardioides sp. NBC_00368]EGD42798.1 hypothetical protein NBCG_02932 [Nocardioidaceae bacterium Broad-1]